MKRFLILLSALLIILTATSESSSYVDPAPKDSVKMPVDSLYDLGHEKSADSISKVQKSKSLTPVQSLKDTSIYNIISTRKLILTTFIFILAYFAIRILIKVLQLISERSTRYRITIKGLIPLIRVVAWSAVILFVIAGIFKPSQATLIAFSASIGVAVGFASQDILKNIFGGIVIIFDQPFKVGDKIEIGKYYGEVIEIGLRSTQMVTPDDSIVAVPNSEVMNQSVSNANTGELNCQVVAELYLPIDIDTVKVRQLALEAAQTSNYIYLKKPITVLFFQEIKEKRTYYKMRLKAYVMDIRYEFVFKSEMTEILTRALLREGILQDDF
jgi:small-conductance mechanosensitive channel